MGQKNYYYLRSGKIHNRIDYKDNAIDLTKEEDNQIKTEIAESPNDKILILEKHWKKLIDNGIKPYDFHVFLDEKCSKKRREMKRLGL